MPFKFEIKNGKLYEFDNPNPVIPEIFNEDHIRVFKLFQDIINKSKTIGIPLVLTQDRYSILTTGYVSTKCKIKCVCCKILFVSSLTHSYPNKINVDKKNDYKLINELKENILYDVEQVRCKKCDSFYEFYRIHDEVRALKIN